MDLNSTNNDTTEKYFKDVGFDVPMDIIKIALWQEVLRLSAVVIAALLNCVVILVVSCSGQLRLYPRHLFWAVVAVVNLFYVSQYVVEIVAISYRVRLACQIFTLNAGVGYSLLLLSLALSAFDRYLAVTHYDWYQRHVTNRKVIVLLITSFILTYILVTIPYWTGLKSFKNCAINLTHMHIVLAVDISLGVFCICLHILIFRKARVAIRNYVPQANHPMRMRFSNGQPTAAGCRPSRRELIASPGAEIAAASDAAEYPAGIPAQYTSAIEYLSCFPRRNSSNRLEVRAAWNLSVMILPFWICTFPVSCNAIVVWYCAYFRLNCSVIYHINPYIRDLFLIHSIYNPAMYIALSVEFRRALDRCSTRFVCLFS